MSFVPHVIPSRPDIRDVYGENADMILDKSVASNLVGLLRQLNIVSKFASEIMSDLMAETKKQTERIGVAQSRSAKLETFVPTIENMFASIAPNEFYDHPSTKTEWKRQDFPRGGFFQRERASPAVNYRRTQAAPVPDLSGLDTYNQDGRPCIKNYSDPDFFVEQWLAQEHAKYEEYREKMARPRRKKHGRRTKKDKVSPAQVKKKQYRSDGTVENPSDEKKETGFELTEDMMDLLDRFRPGGIMRDRFEEKYAEDANMNGSFVLVDDHPRVDDSFVVLNQDDRFSSTTSSSHVPPPTLIPAFPILPSLHARRDSNGSRPQPPPPPPTVPAYHVASMSSSGHQPDSIHALDEQPRASSIQFPQPPLSSFSSTQEPSQAFEYAKDVLGDSPEVVGKSREEVVSPPKPSIHPSRALLLDAVRQRDFQLTKPKQSRPARARPMDLMQAIRDGQKLRPVDKETRQEERHPQEGNLIFQILKIRPLIAGSDDEDSDSSSGSEWE